MPTKKLDASVVGQPTPVELIERRIYLIRGHKVMIDSDLAELYLVETKNLNKAVRRNLDRFPGDFMFQLAPVEAESLRFQFGTSNEGRGGRRSMPYAFTEQGVAMLSSVLNSKRAVQVNIAIMRAFVRLRELLSTQKDVAHKLEEIERAQKEHGAHINAIWKAIERLIEPEEKSKRRIGYKTV
jgi:phage regulator Rha-like protein